MAVQATAVFAVIRVTPNGGQPLGTAFAVSQRYLVTAFHVTSGVDQGLRLIRPHVPGNEHYQDTTITDFPTVPVTIHAADPVRDLAILDLGSDICGSSFTSLTSTDDVEVGGAVFTFGFPHVDTGRFVLTERQTSVGARILIGNQGVTSKHIVVNLQGRPGQSGSPVLSPNGSVTSVVVGGYAPAASGSVMIAGIDPTTLHETTHAISAEYLKAMLP